MAAAAGVVRVTQFFFDYNNIIMLFYRANIIIKYKILLYYIIITYTK